MSEQNLILSGIGEHGIFVCKLMVTGNFMMVFVYMEK